MHPSSVQLAFTMLVSSALMISLCSCTSTQQTTQQAIQQATENPVVFEHESSDSYKEMNLHGFTVLVSSAAQLHPKATNPALDLLEQKLAQVIELTPAHTHQSLRQVQFWIEHNNPGFPCACYHPGAQWLSDNGYNTDKTGGIEISNPEHFVEWTMRDQPLMVLHELAHAYHDRVIGFNDQDILDTFEQAQLLETYESVAHVSGDTRRHYALNNEREYFAELTESYFGMNDFEPFTRDELARFDPVGLIMIEQAWGITDASKHPTE